MSVIRNIISDLVEKKLWPFALLGVIAIALTPMLGRPGTDASVAQLPAAVAKEDTGPELALTRSSLTGFTRAPRVSDKRVDPFASRDLSKLQKKIDKLVKAAVAAAVSNGTIAAGGGGGAGGGESPVDNTVTPPVTTDPGTKDPGTSDVPATTPVKTEEDDLLSILVQAGDSEPQQIADIRTLSPLTDPTKPFLVYVGKAAGNKATFLVSSDAVVDPTGQGSCSPTPADCRTLTMAIGDTAKFTITSDNNAKISMTVIDLETTKVPVDDGTTDTATAARLEAKGRAVGAKTLKVALSDQDIAKSLIRNKIRIRH